MDEALRIINGDAIASLKKIETESVDLIFADPPFNVERQYKGFKDKNEAYKQWCNDWIAECFRILKPTGSFYLMTIDRHLEWKFPIMSSHGVFINLLKWRNVSSASDKRRFWPSVQPILVYGKTANYKFNTYAQKRSVMLTAKGQKSKWGKNDPKGQILDYWDDIKPVTAGNNIHPEAILEPGKKKRKAHSCQMPEMLPGRAIVFSTDEGDLVLDLFSGSGTTAIACDKLNRKCIVIEQGNQYIGMIKQRVKKRKQQLF